MQRYLFLPVLLTFNLSVHEHFVLKKISHWLNTFSENAIEIVHQQSNFRSFVLLLITLQNLRMLSNQLLDVKLSPSTLMTSKFSHLNASGIQPDKRMTRYNIFSSRRETRQRSGRLATLTLHTYNLNYCVYQFIVIYQIIIFCEKLKFLTF